MIGELNILIFTTTFLFFYLANSHPSTSNLARATLQDYSCSGIRSQIRLNTLNASGLLTELLIRPMWTFVDGNYTPWIAYKGCFDITTLHREHKHHTETILNNNVEGCYLECQKENISCKQNQRLHFALKESQCFCICKIQEFLENSNKCNKSCSSDGACRSHFFTVYIEYSQPSTLERIQAIANEHCRARNELLVSLNNLNDTGSSSTDLLIRRILSTVDGKYTTWIAYIDTNDRMTNITTVAANFSTCNPRPVTNSQPSTSNLTRVTLQDYSCSGIRSQIRLNTLNTSGLLTELLIRPMWTVVDGNYTPWIAYKGCFDITTLHQEHKHHTQTILNNTVERCYLECQKENISCKQNQRLYFALTESQCYCICKIQEFLANSNKCNKSCSSDDACRSHHFTVYIEYIPDYERSDELCLVCSKADTNIEAKFSFTCDGEPFRLCVKREEICFGIKDDGSLNFSKINCAQLLPYVCWENNGISSELSSTNPSEISSSIPPLESFTSFDKATTSNIDVVGVFVSLFGAIFALTSVVLLLWHCITKRKRKLRDSQIDLHHLQPSQLVNNTYTDVMHVSETNRSENDVPLTTTNDDIYVENEEGEYDHLHTSRPKQVVSEREDERYATCTQLEDDTYSTVTKSRNSAPDRDNEYDSLEASLDNTCRSVANPDYEFCFQSSQRKDI